MITFLKNTNIAELLQVSSGDLAALEKMTEEFRQRVQEPMKVAAAASSSGSTSSDAVPPKS